MLNPAEYYVLQEINKLGGLPEIEESVNSICNYINKCYYPSKNRRLSLWNPDKGEIVELVIAVFTITLSNKNLTYQAIAGMVAGRINLPIHIDQVKTAAEVIAIIASTSLITLTKKGSGVYIMINTTYSLEGIPEPSKHEILMEPIPIYNSNYDETMGSRILGGKVNHHEDDICLDHINRVNSIKYALNKPFLRKYEEAPTFALNTPEKKDQWELFIRTSYRKYIQIAQQGNVFYLNHNYDKRGRCYAEGYHVNTQGASFKKAIIELANKELVEGD